MPFGLISNPGTIDGRISTLRHRLDSFYDGVQHYYETPGDNKTFYTKLRPYVERIIGLQGRVRVLELGAGLSSFGNFWGANRCAIEYHAQDVTARNKEHLAARAERVHIGDVSAIDDAYDLVFSTFVLEHIANPAEFLTEVARLVVPGGLHIVFCPNYEVPGYLCPSMRHLPASQRMSAMLFLTGSRIRARLDGRPRFWVNADPAAFHRPWYRDADAVHVVSRFDVVQWHRMHHFDVERIPMVPLQTVRSARALFYGLLTRETVLAAAFTKREVPRPRART